MFHNNIIKVLNWLRDIVSMRIFLYLYILNLVANCLSILYFQNLLAYVSFVMLAAIITFVEVIPIKLFSQLKWLKNVIVGILVILINGLIVVDIFLIKEFNLLFGEDVINIIADTNPTEVSNFASTYLSFSNILVITSIVILINLVAFFVSKFVVNFKRIWIVNSILCVGGVFLCCISVYSQKVFGSGLGIPQYASITRYVHAGYLLNKRYAHVENLQNICKDVVSTTSINDDRIIILVIGESFSKAHSSLYGYKLSTNPLLGKLKENGELICFENVITPYNATHSTMQALFSVGEFGSSPLFPCFFKEAGYYTHISENQYLLGAAMNFLTDKKLSDLMFSNRQEFKYVHDEQMIDALVVNHAPALYILHLQGQHYAYENRYPNTFNKFTCADYDEKKWDESQRKIIAHYDNATLYNDYVINKLINKCRDKNVCLIYLSDHGEEVYDERDYMGHGDISKSKKLLDYQVRIPFIIWVSDKFKLENNELVDKIKQNENTPITTNDISHILLGLGNIDCDYYKPNRDFLNDKYDKSRHRITLNSVDYDAL